MKRNLTHSIATLLLSLIPLMASAGANDSIYVMGWPRDAFTMEPVIDSTRVELMTLDSTVIATAVPHWNKQYRPNSYFSMTVGFRSGEYLVRLTNPRYQTTTERFRIKLKKYEDTYSIGTIKMRRAPLSRQLGEVAVTATKIKFYTKGDTLIYNADAFNLAEGSMLDALVEQLPGAELKRDGRIYMNGKLVESVLLNGRDFFKGNNSVLLDNLPAYTVKDLRFYNQKSERSEALKMDLDDARFVMDVRLKREYQVGWLANAEAGGGTHDRWLARLFALRFTPNSRLTFYANANNTHEDRKPGNNGDWSPAGIGNGTSTTQTGGFDYLVHDKNNRFELTGNLNATHAADHTETRQSRERFQAQGSVFSRMRQLNRSQRTDIRSSHNLRFMLGPANKKNETQLYLRPQFGYSRSRNNGEALSAEFAANPVGEGNWENIFNGPTAYRALTDILVHKVRTRQRGHSENIDGGVSSQLYFPLPLSGRLMELSATVQGSRQRAHTFDLYTLDYADDGHAGDHRRRYFRKPADKFEANVGLTWGYGLFSKGFHHVRLSPTLEYNYTHARQENSLYRLDQLEEMNEAGFGTLPSTREALLSVLDRTNSYVTANDDHRVRMAATLYYDYDVRQLIDNDYARTALWRFSLQPGVTLHGERLVYDGAQPYGTRRTEWLPELTVRLQRNTPGMKHQIRLDGNYRQQLPPMFSLLGLRFDSDPLNIREGNSGLRRSETYSVLLWYWAERWGQAQGRRLSGKVAATFVRNAVATAQTYDAATGVRTYRPQNVDGNYNIEATASFHTPLDRRRRLSLNLLFSNYFYRSVDLSGTDSPVPVRSTVYTNYMTVPLSVEFNYKKLRVGAKGQAAWHRARSKRANFQDIDGLNIDAGLYGNVRLPWNLQLATDINYYTRHGFDHAVMNTDNLVWNAQLSKSLLHGALTLALVGYDILGDLSNLNYSVNTQGITETWRNVIPRYGMLRVIYKLNRQPKKKR